MISPVIKGGMKWGETSKIKKAPISVGIPLERTKSEGFPEPQPIQGKMPDSKEEYWLAIALQKMHYNFIFQYNFQGGRNWRRGQIIDFWVYTTPLPTPVWFNGEYWHTGAKYGETMFKVREVEQYYRGEILRPVIIWGSELPSPDDAIRVLREKL